MPLNLLPALRIFSLCALLASLFCGCERDPVAASQPASLPPMEVQLVKPSRGAIVRSITLPGEVKAYQSATLYAKVSGYLKTITVDKGDSVREGALLAEIEAPELLADRSKYKAELDVAELDFKRLSEAEKKAPDLVVPLSVDSARSRAAVARANLDRAETLLQFTRISAPFAGVITRRLVDPGAFIPAAAAGSTPQNSALLTIMDFNRVRVQVAVPEAESSRVAKDQPASIAVEGGSHPVEGQITRFAYALDEATKTMLAEIELPNDTLQLRPGMYATVKIGIEQKTEALLLPADALLLEKSNASVFTLDHNKARKVPVKIGFNDGKKVQIIAGLEPNQPVILLDKRPLSDGQAVRAVDAK